MIFHDGIIAYRAALLINFGLLAVCFFVLQKMKASPFCAAVGLAFIIRYFVYVAAGTANGHVQSLILACTLLLMGFVTFTIGLVSDVIAANRKLLQDTQYHTRRAEYDAIYAQLQLEQEAVKTYHIVGEKPQYDEEYRDSAI
ncbi:MAG: hypothetical protein K1W30_16295 [Lachnospiraceae bacterium]